MLLKVLYNKNEYKVLYNTVTVKKMKNFDSEYVDFIMYLTNDCVSSLVERLLSKFDLIMNKLTHKKKSSYLNITFFF